MGNFKFLKKKIVGPDYYGAGVKRMDWPTFEINLLSAIGQMGSINFQMEIEHQHLWNFVLSVNPESSNSVMLEATGYHTHGMKKGKQLDPELISALLSMGLTQPAGEQRNWSIELIDDELEPAKLANIIVHILEQGYQFNPNLIQEVKFTAK